jgi:hypothetical protein
MHLFMMVESHPDAVDEARGGEHSGKKHVRWDRRHPAHQNNPGTAQDTSLASVVSGKLFRSRCLDFGENIAKFGDGILPNPPKRRECATYPRQSYLNIDRTAPFGHNMLENRCPISHPACFLLCT